MRYLKWFLFMFFYMTIINVVSRDLGLVAVKYTISDFETAETPNLLEALGLAIKIVIDNLQTMLQFATLQADIPSILQVLFISPMVLGSTIIIVLIFRGVS